jgi:two-component system response regulator PhoP
MRALVVEDEAVLREQIVTSLRAEGFAIDESGDGREGLYMATEMPIDIAIVDIGLPELDGLELVRQARTAGITVPMLLLTARDTWQDKVEGLEAGADDYLAKPFHMPELLARLRALLRRTGGWAEATLRFGRLEIDTRAQSVSVDGKVINLTAYEYRLLVYLATHGGEVISKATLLDHLYDESEVRDPNVLEVFIRRLRQKLDPDKTLEPIETLRSRGYRLALDRSSNS